jgi:predicted cupin superfamily sugar epimerase
MQPAYLFLPIWRYTEWNGGYGVRTVYAGIYFNSQYIQSVILHKFTVTKIWEIFLITCSIPRVYVAMDLYVKRSRVATVLLCW